jgi:hypothetical protein
VKGFIVSLRRAKNEDLIVTLLEERALRSYYRFYGARHSILQLGYLIDYESEEESRFMPRLRRVSHMGFPWLFRRNRLMLWQQFISLFEPHLRDTEELDPFYFEMLLQAARRWERQNPKRIVCECTLSLLKFEGRIHPPHRCYICEKPIGDSVALMQALLPAHPHCIYGSALPRQKVEEFFKTGKTTLLEDGEVALLYDIVSKGF